MKGPSFLKALDAAQDTLLVSRESHTHLFQVTERNQGGGEMQVRFLVCQRVGMKLQNGGVSKAVKSKTFYPFPPILIALPTWNLETDQMDSVLSWKRDCGQEMKFPQKCHFQLAVSQT